MLIGGARAGGVLTGDVSQSFVNDMFKAAREDGKPFSNDIVEKSQAWFQDQLQAAAKTAQEGAQNSINALTSRQALQAYALTSMPPGQSRTFSLST